MRLIRFLATGTVLAATVGVGAAQAAPELGVTDRLPDRRYIASGDRAYAVGFEDGRFYANGWHITGEMGGVWTPPLKLVDGVWFGVDDQWIGPAQQFRSGWGYAQMDLPDTAGLRLRRTDFAPDGRRALLFGLELTNPGPGTRTVTVKVDAHSELIGAYPWGFAGVAPNASDNLADSASFDGGALVFREQGKLPHPNAEVHDWAALVASDRRPAGGETGPGHRGDQGDNVCVAEEPPSQCDDGPFGKGQGGQLRYDGAREGPRLGDAVGRRGGLRPGPRGGARRARRRAAGSRAGAAAQGRGARATRGPDAGLAARRPAARGRDRLEQAEPRRLHAGGRGPEDPLHRPGQAVPGARRHGAAGPLVRRRLAGLPVDLRHRRRVHRVRERRPRPVRDEHGPHARAARHLGDRQRGLGQARARDRARRLDLVRRQPGPGQHRRDHQVPQHRRAAVALDRRQPLPRRDVRLRQAQPALRRRRTSTPTTTAGPRASATSSARAWARRSSTTPSTTSAACTTSPTSRARRATGERTAGRRDSPTACTGASRPTGGCRTRACTPIRWAPRTRRSSRSTGSRRRRWSPS